MKVKRTKDKRGYNNPKEIVNCSLSKIRIDSETRTGRVKFLDGDGREFQIEFSLRDILNIVQAIPCGMCMKIDEILHRDQSSFMIELINITRGIRALCENKEKK